MIAQLVGHFFQPVASRPFQEKRVSWTDVTADGFCGLEGVLKVGRVAGMNACINGRPMQVRGVLADREKEIEFVLGDLFTDSLMRIARGLTKLAHLAEDDQSTPADRPS